MIFPSAGPGYSWPRETRPQRWRCWSHCGSRWKQRVGQDERLKAMVLQAVALHAHGEKDKAVQLLGDALALAEPGGFIRLFVDEGAPMAQLLSEAAAHGIMPDYVGKLLAAFKHDEGRRTNDSTFVFRRPSIIVGRAIEPTRVRSTATHRPGTLESRDWRAALPRPEYG